MSPIHILEVIFCTGAKVNALDGLGQTALHRCARRDAAAACRLLLAHRSDPQLISLQGYTALQLAGDNAAPILQGKIKLSNISWNILIIKFFTDARSEDGVGNFVESERRLLEAARAGDVDTARRLLRARPHLVNCRDLDGRHSTPLHFAAGYNRVRVVELLLQHGADVHAKDKGYLFNLKKIII